MSTPMEVGVMKEKIGFSSALTIDAAFKIYRKGFFVQLGLAYFWSLLLLAAVGLVVWLGMFVIMPPLAANAQNPLLFSISAMLVVFAIAVSISSFFRGLMEGAGVIHARSLSLIGAKELKFLEVIKMTFANSLRVSSVTLAQTLILIPIVLIVSLIHIPIIGSTEIGSILSALLNPSWRTIISVLLILATYAVCKSLFFTSVPIAIFEKNRFFSAVIKSCKTIISERGFLKVFGFTLLWTLTSLGNFTLIFLIFYILLPSPAALPPIVFHAVLAYIVAIATSPIWRNLSVLMYEPPTSSDDNVAGSGARVLAGAVDLLIFAGVFFAVFGLLLWYFRSNAVLINLSNIELVGWMVIILAFFVTYTVYNVYFEIFEGGQTIGKRIFGLRVVTLNGRELRPLQSILRNFFRIMDMLLAAPVFMMLRSDSLRIADILMDTKVIYKKEKEYAANELF